MQLVFCNISLDQNNPSVSKTEVMALQRRMFAIWESSKRVRNVNLSSIAEVVHTTCLQDLTHRIYATTSNLNLPWLSAICCCEKLNWILFCLSAIEYNEEDPGFGHDLSLVLVVNNDDPQSQPKFFTAVLGSVVRCRTFPLLLVCFFSIFIYVPAVLIWTDMDVYCNSATLFTPFSLSIFSYTSSSTPHPCQWVSHSVIVSD